MEVRTVEETPVSRTLEIDVDPKLVERTWAQAYRDLARRVRVRGFRPGKAPRKLLSRLYGATLAEEIERTLVARTLPDAIEQARVAPVSEPAIEAEPPAEQGPFTYRARLEVKPQIQLPDTQGLPARRPPVEVSEADVQQQLEALRQQQAQLLEEPEDAAVRHGHVVTVDFVGRVDGQPFEGGSGRDARVEVGSGSFPEDLEEGLLGARSGEDREIPVRFPDDYPNPELAGRQAEFAVHVSAIQRREVPELDDELAKDLGDFGSLRELHDRVRSDLVAQRERASRDALRRSLMDALIERADFEVPPGLVERALARRLQTAHDRLEGQVPEEALHAQLDRWREEWREEALREVREGLLLEAVADDRGLEVADAEVDARIEEIAQERGVARSRLEKAFPEGALRDLLRVQLRDERALDALVAEANVEETTDT